MRAKNEISIFIIYLLLVELISYFSLARFFIWIVYAQELEKRKRKTERQRENIFWSLTFIKYFLEKQIKNLMRIKIIFWNN